jgi:hypothetical protein
MDSILPYKNSYEMIFQGKEYLVNIKAEYDRMLLLIEEKLSYNRWRGEYTSQAIEQITQKANGDKTYEQFVRIMLMALEQKTDKIFIDFLTPQDIELLKAKRKSNSQTQNKNSSSNPQQSTKRFVILTQSTDFDKVHFPLTLYWIVNPDQESLKRTLKRVAEEYKKMKTFDDEARSSCYSSSTNEFFKTGMANYNPLLEENKQLKKKLQLLVEAKMETQSEKPRRDDFSIQSKKWQLQVMQLRSKVEETQTEIDRAESEFGDTQSSFN